MSINLHIQPVRFAMATFLFVVLMGDLASAKTMQVSHKKKEYISHLSKNVKTKHTKHTKATKDTKHPKPKRNTTKTIVGLASFYGYESGNKTASGERFKPLGKTAAHRTLPLHSTVKVTNLKNNKSVVVTINDRGPFVKGRVIDLSLGAARIIGMTGTQKVSIELL